VIIEAFANDCYRFLYWKDADGAVLSVANPLPVTVEMDWLFIAHFERDSVKLTVQTTVGGSVNPEVIDSVVACGDLITIKATPDEYWQFVNWNDGNSEEERTITPKSDTKLTAYFKEIPRIKFTVRASEHQQIDPRTTNYEIPIYITSEESFNDLMIESLAIEIDKSMFYPRSIDNGDFISNDNGLLTFENMIIPSLLANEETILMKITGDFLLADKDSSEIVVRTVEFSDLIHITVELLQGFITLDLCDAGNGRLMFFDYVPEVLVKNNPIASDILEIECKTIENGDYTLEIVDMYGASTVMHEFTVSGSRRIFDFDIDISDFASGAYIIIMHTPSAKYSTKFVRQ
jgi:hypothetical protein